MFKEELLEIYNNGEIERMTWREFLLSCDASHYFWDHYPKNVLEEKENFVVVKVDLSDDSDIHWWDSWELNFVGENEILIDWGIPVIITDYENSDAPFAFMLLQKTEKGYVPASGELYSTYEEAEKELEEILEQD